MYQVLILLVKVQLLDMTMKQVRTMSFNRAVMQYQQITAIKQRSNEKNVCVCFLDTWLMECLVCQVTRLGPSRDMMSSLTP